MNYADFFAAPNGFPLESDATLGFMQSDYQAAINGLAKLAGGDLVIVSGMIDDGLTVTDGWFIWDGVLTKFTGGVKQANIVLQETVVQKQNDNGQMVDRYYTRTAVFGSGSGSITYASLKRIQTVEKIYDTLLQLFALEPAVIMQGLAVTNVQSGPGTLDIGAGVVIIDGQVIDIGAYSGTYPIYLNDTGQWQNSVPSGTYIVFNPYTSQRLGSVYKRATKEVGEVIMQVVASDRFDATGLGRWEMSGFAIMNGANGTADMRGRFPVAYDERVSDPLNDIWDPAYNTPGTNGGAKEVVLTVDEIPAHDHDVSFTNAQSYTGPPTSDKFGSGDASPEDQTETTAETGGGEGHENRPPFKVLVFAQRI